MADGERVIIVEMPPVDKLSEEETKRIGRKIDQKIRGMKPQWVHTVVGQSTLETTLGAHRNDEVYVVGFDYLDLTPWKNVIHIKLDEELMGKR